MTLTDADLDRLDDRAHNDMQQWEANQVSALIAEVRQWRAEGAWRPMDSAPTDGTIIEAVGRYKDANAGFPRHVGFWEGEWLEYRRALPVPIVCWAWRPRDDSWPSEPSPPRSEP